MRLKCVSVSYVALNCALSVIASVNSSHWFLFLSLASPMCQSMRPVSVSGPCELQMSGVEVT